MYCTVNNMVRMLLVCKISGCLGGSIARAVLNMDTKVLLYPSPVEIGINYTYSLIQTNIRNPLLMNSKKQSK
jgi:hypothetical protein